MTKWTLTAALACGLAFFAAASGAADDAKKDRKADANADGKSVTGILVDNHCGDKLTTPKMAARHPEKCMKDEQCAKTGFQVIVGDKHLKFDEKGNTLAKEFIESEDFTSRVVVMGTPGEDGKTIRVTSLKAAPVEKKQEKKDGENTARTDKGEKAEKATATEKKAKKDDGAAKEEKSEKSSKSEK